MTDDALQRSRERLAREQVGRTKVSRGLALVLVAQFLLLVVAVPFSEVLYDLRNPRAADNLRGRLKRLLGPLPSPKFGPLSRIVSSNRALIEELERFGDEAEESSRLGQRLRPPTQSLLVRLGAGNEQVYLGRQGWLFYRDDLDYLTGPDFLEPGALLTRSLSGNLGNARRGDPRLAVLHLNAQLERRGIRLVVMPTPVKPSIHPERFAQNLVGREAPLRPPSFTSFVQELEARDVLVFDPAPALLEAKRRSGTSYLMTDTHWRPEALELVAERLVDFLMQRTDLPPTPPARLVREKAEVSNRGDIARMLDLPDGQTRYPVERVELSRITTAESGLWRPSRSADILLLGDSFSNIYSLGEMGWGESAGLAEQLSYVLGRPLDRIVQNANGAFATRELLAMEMARGSDRLAGKRVVLFQFAERELAAGDWKLVDLQPRETATGDFFVPDPGEAVIVSGTIREMAPIPRPGTVPYSDHITSLHLVDLGGDRAGVGGRQAVVYIWSMRDHLLQEIARSRPGERITLRLRRWGDVASQYDGVSRTELADEAASFQEPCWGEVLE